MKNKIIFCLLLLAFSAQGAEQLDSEFLYQQCRSLAVAKLDFDFHVSTTPEMYAERKLSIYSFERKKLNKEWIVIDVTSSDQAVTNSLKLPLHSLKYKKYLTGKRLLLLGDGVNYQDLEQQAVWLTQYLAKEVKIFFGGKPAWLGEEQSKALAISPAEFVVESELGIWAVINSAQEWQQTQAQIERGEISLNALDRVLLMQPELAEQQVSSNLASKVFVLKGGAKALKQFSQDQAKILAAVHERAMKARCQSVLDV